MARKRLSFTSKTPAHIDQAIFSSAKQKQMTYEWPFERMELVVKKQYKTDVPVVVTDMVVKVDYDRAVVGVLSAKCVLLVVVFHVAQSIYENARKMFCHQIKLSCRQVSVLTWSNWRS